jgi:hypothetical protein
VDVTALQAGIKTRARPLRQGITITFSFLQHRITLRLLHFLLFDAIADHFVIVKFS